MWKSVNMKKLLLVIKTRLQFSNMFTCCVPEGEENAIELLSLKPVVCKHTICSGHSTDVNSFSLGRQKKKMQVQPRNTFESFALPPQFGKSLSEPSRCICKMFAVGMPAHIRHLSFTISTCTRFHWWMSNSKRRRKRLQQYVTVLGARQ